MNIPVHKICRVAKTARGEGPFSVERGHILVVTVLICHTLFDTCRTFICRVLFDVLIRTFIGWLVNNAHLLFTVMDVIQHCSHPTTPTVHTEIYKHSELKVLWER